MRRYRFLNKENVYDALNRLRDAFLAAKDGEEVNQIIDGILTHDEKLKIGRRIIVAECVELEMSIHDIARELKVGKNTVLSVLRSLEKNSNYLKLIKERRKKVRQEYNVKKYREVGGSTLVFKKKEYTGFTRKDVKR